MTGHGGTHRSAFDVASLGDRSVSTWPARAAPSQGHLTMGANSHRELTIENVNFNFNSVMKIENTDFCTHITNLYELLYTHSNVYLSVENIIFVANISNINLKIILY